MRRDSFRDGTRYWSVDMNCEPTTVNGCQVAQVTPA